MSTTLEQISGYSASVRPELPGLSLAPWWVILQPDAESYGWWTAQCPALRGCISQGQSLEEALVNIREAMELWLETALEAGDFVPAADCRCFNNTMNATG